MPELAVYQGRPCYIRMAYHIEYIDDNLPSTEVFVILDDSEEDFKPPEYFWSEEDL